MAMKVTFKRDPLFEDVKNLCNKKNLHLVHGFSESLVWDLIGQGEF